MAVHKVPQDVEAEDKFLGPLTFKQFLFTGGAGISGYLIFLTASKGIWPISVIFGFPFIVCAFLAFPWSKEQPTELWLASRIRFLIKPRKRIWDQSGLKELVSITVPKRLAHNYTDGLNQSQVESRLSALATMVDSRGWAVKNFTVSDNGASDRLVDGNIKARSTVAVLENPDDVMDEQRSIIAQQFDTKIQASEQKHKSETMRLIREARDNAPDTVKDIQTQARQAQPAISQPSNKPSNKQQEDFWFMHTTQDENTDPSLAVFQPNPVIQPGNNSSTTQLTAQSTADDSTMLDEEALLAKAHEKQRRDALQTYSSHEKTLSPIGDETASMVSDEPTAAVVDEPVKAPSIPPVTTVSDPDILNLARNNDLNLETLSRTAKRDRDLPTEEVVVSLH